MKSSSESAPSAGVGRWRRMTTILSALLGAAIVVTGSGVQPTAAASTLRGPRGASEEARGALAARQRAFWPNRFTVSGNLTQLGSAVASVNGTVGGSTDAGVTVLIDVADEKEFAAIKSDFASQGLALNRVRRYTIDVVRPQPDGSREQGWSWQWSLFGSRMRGKHVDGTPLPSTPYGLDMMNAWKQGKGNGAVVAVLDTGILPMHPDLIGTRFVPGYDFVCWGDLTDCNDNDMSLGSDSDPSDPGDWCPEDGDAASSSWHGTHVTGTIAAQLNRTGIAGIAPDAKILPVRVLGQCGGTDADINAAIRWAAGLPVAAGANGQAVPRNTNPADVINLSLGGWGECDGSTAAAIAAARRAGAVVVVSAGNSNDDARNYSPAGCTEAFTVSALGPDGFPSNYTNVGPTVDIAAPGGEEFYRPYDNGQSGLAGYPGCPFGVAKLGDGVDEEGNFEHPDWTNVASVWCQVWTDYYDSGMIVSTVSSDRLDFEGNYGWDWYQGTSMAAPHVSAVVALIASKYPTMSPARIEAAITGSAVSLPSRSSAFANAGTGSYFLENYVLAYGDEYDDAGEYGLDWPDTGDPNATWTEFFEEDYFPYGPGFMEFAFGCSETSAVGVMGFEIYGTDPCATDWDGVGYWEIFGWAETNSYDGTAWSDPIYNPYSVNAGDDCNELGCGAGALNAMAALNRARSLVRVR